MSKDVLHVVPNNEGWGVKREGNERLSSTHETQKQAIDTAREMAKEGDDIVVHRQDGTIRERITSSTALEKSNGADRATLKPRDIMSVGTRVSWGAVIAGAVVAFAVYLTLTMLALAIGVTTIDHLHHRTFAIGAAVVGLVALLAALFLGGYVASRTTAGETREESLIYGVLVWGSTLALALLLGSTLTMGAGAVLQPLAESRDNPAWSADEAQAKLGLSEEQRQKYEQTMGAARSVAASVDPVTLAWWAFASLVLSLLAAMAGSLAGAGPEFVFRRLFLWRQPAPQSTA